MAINLNTYNKYCGICIHNLSCRAGKVYCNSSKKEIEPRFEVCAAQEIQKDENGKFNTSKIKHY